MKRKVVLFLSIVIILANIASPAIAADNSSNSSEKDTVSPVVIVPESTFTALYTLITSAYTGLYIDYRGCAYLTGALNCKPGVDRNVISCYLQRYNSGWKTVQHWRKTTYGTTATLSCYWFVSSGYTYRALIYFYAYDGELSESTSGVDTEYY